MSATPSRTIKATRTHSERDSACRKGNLSTGWGGKCGVAQH